MAKVKIQGHASGTGILTVTAPNTSTDRTITLPDATATIATTTDVAARLPSITDGGNATAMTIDANENIGIGVVPETWDSNYDALQIGGNGAVAATPSQAAGGKTLLGQNVYVDSSYKYISTDEASLLYQQNGGFEVRVAPSGSADASITWTKPLEILNDRHIIMGNSAGSDKIEFRCEYSNPQIQIFGAATTNTNKMTFDNGNGTVGSIATNGSTTEYATSSDYRLKENVNYDWDATTRLKQLKPAKFNFIADADTTVEGFIAHEVSSIVPVAIVGEKDAMKDEEYEVTPAVMDGDTVVTPAVMGTRSVPDYQGIDQSKLVPLLVKTIQELEARITALEA